MGALITSGSVATAGVAIGATLVGGIIGALSGGIIGELLDNYILAPLFSFDEELSEQYKNFKWFGEDGFFVQFKSSFTDGSWKEALDLWGQDINDGLDALFGIETEPFYKTFGEIKDSFTNGSWKEALELWGQDIHNAFITLGERIAERWESIKSAIIEKLSEIKSGISEKLEIIKESWSNTWSFMKEKVSSVIQSIKSVISSAVSWISGQINAIKATLGGLSTAARNMTSGKLGSAMGGALRSSRTMTYSMSPSVNAAMAGLSEIEFPGYATGQVIPRTMRQHLAILGDNNRETEVVSPLSTIEQAVRNAIGGAQPQEINLNLIVECEGHQLLQIMQKLDGEYFKQTGKHAFA